MARPQDLEFHQPATLEEASRLLRQLGPGTIVYAGGTDVIPRMRLKKIAPRHLVNIKRISGLDGISFDGRTIHLGALARFNDIIVSPVVKQHLPVIADVSGMIGSHQVRNLATVGGNICNAAPSADSAPILIALGARLRIFSLQGARETPLETFFKGPGSVHLAPGEILTQILVDKPSPAIRAAYHKHEIREALEIAITGVAVALDISTEGVCRHASVVVAACAPTPVRARRAEAILEGSRLEADVIERAAEAASGDISPIDDVRGCSQYRRDMTGVALVRAIERAMGGGAA
jgi:CO/xanthine dehydrogenase FAD-binding subunit